MENLEKNKLNEKTKMEILKALHEIIWDTNYFLGKVANSDSAEFDYEQFKHDLQSHCKFLSNDVYVLLNIKL